MMDKFVIVKCDGCLAEMDEASDSIVYLRGMKFCPNCGPEWQQAAELKSLRDAWEILNKTSLSLVGAAPDAVWAVAFDAKQHIDQQIKSLLRRAA